MLTLRQWAIALKAARVAQQPSMGQSIPDGPSQFLGEAFVVAPGLQKDDVLGRLGSAHAWNGLGGNLQSTP